MSFHRPVRLENDYARFIESLFKKWVTLPKGASLDDIFNALTQSSSERVGGIAEQLARGMVTAVGKVNATSWRQAARKSTQGRRIHDLLVKEMSGPVGEAFRSYISANARLIKSLPQDLAQDVVKQIATRQMRGERADVIAADIRKRIPEITKAKIQLIARTQVAMTATAISKVRAENLKLPCYEWLTSEDVRVRVSHKKLDHVIVFWNDPPSPEALVGEKSYGNYNAGQTFNCRCDANVVVDLDQLNWPMRVYRNGLITRISRAKFAALL